MMVFFKERLVVLAMPKTGSTAYQDALRDRADMIITAPPALKHAPLYRYNRFIRPMFEKVCDAEMEVAVVVREPISWLSSWWRFRQREALEDQPQSTRGITFDSFVEAYMTGQRPPYAEVGSQSKFVEPRPNGTRISHLFAYEDLPRFNRFLESRLGSACAPQQVNQSPEIPVALDPRIEEKYRRKHAADFDLHARALNGEPFSASADARSQPGH